MMVYDYYPHRTPPVSPPPQRLFLRLPCPRSCAEAGPGAAGVGPAAVCPLPPASSACAAAPALNGGSPSGGEPQIRRGAPEKGAAAGDEALGAAPTWTITSGKRFGDCGEGDRRSRGV